MYNKGFHSFCKCLVTNGSLLGCTQVNVTGVILGINVPVVSAHIFCDMAGRWKFLNIENLCSNRIIYHYLTITSLKNHVPVTSSKKKKKLNQFSKENIVIVFFL